MGMDVKGQHETHDKGADGDGNDDDDDNGADYLRKRVKSVKI